MGTILDGRKRFVLIKSSDCAVGSFAVTTHDAVFLVRLGSKFKTRTVKDRRSVLRSLKWKGVKELTFYPCYYDYSILT